MVAQGRPTRLANDDPEAKDVYEVARRVNLSPPRVHELADEMYRYARKLDCHALAAQAKYP